MLSVHLILLAATIYNLYLAGLVLWKTPTHHAGRVFAWYIFWIAAWIFCGAMILSPYADRSMVCWLSRAAYFCGTCAIISGLWFFTIFPSRKGRFYLVALALIALGLPWLALSWTSYIVVGATAEPWWQYVKTGSLAPWMAGWYILSYLAFTLHLALKVRQVRGLERLQVKYILLGTSVTAVGGILTNILLPIYTHTSSYAPLGLLSSLFFTTTVTYAIVRYRVLDIRIVLRVGLVYSISIGLISLLFALLVPVLDQFLTAYLQFPSRTGAFCLAFIMALSFQPLRRAVQDVLDRRWFFEGVSDYRLGLRETCGALASAHDPEMLAGTVMEAVARLLQPQGVAVWLAQGEPDVFRCIVTDGRDTVPALIPAQHPVLTYACQADDILVTDELLRQSEPMASYGRQLKSWNAAVLAPLITGSHLCGVVLLGEKTSGDIYTTDDLGLLRILGKQAALALENTRHLHDVLLLNEYHERLLHAMQDGVIALDPAGRIRTFNPTAERITGIAGEIALGKGLREIGLAQLPAFANSRETLEMTLDTPEGREAPVLVTITPFQRRGDRANSHLLVIHDLSALRELEKEKVLAERYSSMGALAASLAHEINTPLAPIRAYAAQIPELYDNPQFRQEFSRTVIREVDRINHLVGEMLDLVRKPSGDRALVDLRQVLDSLLLLVRPECESNNIVVRVKMAEELPRVFGAAGQIYQAVLNALVHAIQSMPRGGELTITLADQGKRVLCRISDTGPGLPPQDLSMLTELGASSTGQERSLALVTKFIKAHDGEVWAESTPGAGFTLNLALPAWQGG